MACVITIMRPSQETEMRKVDLPVGYDQINALVRPLVGGEIEHVAVLYNNKRQDMFVDENGQYKDLPRNEIATAMKNVDISLGCVHTLAHHLSEMF